MSERYKVSNTIWYSFCGKPNVQLLGYFEKKFRIIQKVNFLFVNKKLPIRYRQLN